MVRTYIRKRPVVDKDNLKKAISAVINDKYAIRRAAKEFNVGRSTLARHCELAENGVIKLIKPGHGTIFDEEQESAFFNYISKISNVHSGLSSKEIRKLAYAYANSLNLNMPNSWKEQESAGKDWFSNFVKRHNGLTRKPQRSKMNCGGDINFDQLLQSVRTIKAENNNEKDAILIEDDIEDDDDDDPLLERLK